MTIYDEAVTKMSRLLKERKICWYSRKAHEQCYAKLKEHLESVNKDYSYSEARKWLKEVIKCQESSAGFWAKWNYIDQLEELIHTGTVLQDHLKLTKSNYQKLSVNWRSELDRYLEACDKKYTQKTKDLIKIRCSRFLLFLQSQKIDSIHEISYEILCDFFEYEMPVKPKERYIILSNVRSFLQYYVSLGECEPVFPLLLDEAVYKYAVFHDKNELVSFKELQEPFVCKSGDIYDSVDAFVLEFENLGYKNTAKYNAVHVIRCLYTFLVVNHLDYNIRTAELWCERIKPLIGSSYHSWIRTITLFDLYIRGQKFNLLKKYTFQKSRDSGYPLWCSRAVDDYLDWLRRSFHSESTVRSYKYTVYNFCDFILSRKLDSFQNLTRNLINDFMRKDFHSTVNGMSGRNTVLRQFITHLEDNNYLQDKTLHTTVPSKLAHPRKIVTILSEDQISAINEYRKECILPIEFRDAAMVMTGLKLGFRSSDVIRLKLTDIDWISRKISIIQYKTKTPLTLPLEVDVGNTIFRYLKYGRPVCNSPYVFVRHKAPYGMLSGKICSNALNRILQACGHNSSVKFHTLRKTFATNILKNDAGMERVIDALGHQDPTTVNTYLTYDEVHMRMCALSLREMSIPSGGVRDDS